MRYNFRRTRIREFDDFDENDSPPASPENTMYFAMKCVIHMDISIRGNFIILNYSTKRNGPYRSYHLAVPIPDDVDVDLIRWTYKESRGDGWVRIFLPPRTPGVTYNRTVK
ncbi:hypothetical protein Q1695_001607 [Nippostrongylus brasiliensis]|nr:hypothetical protein Q1695_001607 [Nippostrongylus brasiliensis]